MSTARATYLSHDAVRTRGLVRRARAVMVITDQLRILTVISQHYKFAFGSNIAALFSVMLCLIWSFAHKTARGSVTVNVRPGLNILNDHSATKNLRAGAILWSKECEIRQTTRSATFCQSIRPLYIQHSSLWCRTKLLTLGIIDVLLGQRAVALCADFGNVKFLNSKTLFPSLAQYVVLLFLWKHYAAHAKRKALSHAHRQ